MRGQELDIDNALCATLNVVRLWRVGSVFWRCGGDGVDMLCAVLYAGGCEGGLGFLEVSEVLGLIRCVLLDMLEAVSV